MAVDTVVRSRRAVLMGAIGAVAATVGSALGRPAEVRAGVDGDVVLDAVNNGGGTTAIHRASGQAAVFEVTTISASGEGLRATADGWAIIATGNFVGVRGQSTVGTGVQGESTSGHAVDGRSEQVGAWGQSTHGEPTTDFDTPSNHTGVLGIAGYEGDIPVNTDETGVFGFCDLSPISTGIWGDSNQGFGVFGSGDVGVGGNGFLGVYGVASGAGASGVLGRGGPGQTGVYGFAGAGIPPAPTPNVAVQAKAETASEIALNVIGRAKFSQSGRTSIATNKSSIVITKSGVTSSSYIIATLQTKRTGIYVQSVVPAAGKFTVYLNKVVPGTTYVGWLVIN